MQKVNLYEPIVSSKAGSPPLTLRVGVVANDGYIEGGPPETYYRPEVYVLLSALPADIRQRIVTAVQSIIAGM